MFGPLFDFLWDMTIHRCTWNSKDSNHAALQIKDLRALRSQRMRTPKGFCGNSFGILSEQPWLY